MTRPQSCPDESTLWDFLQDRVADTDADRVDDHIGGCPACQRTLDRLVGSLPGRWLVDSGGTDEDAPGTRAATASLGVMPRVLVERHRAGRRGRRDGPSGLARDAHCRQRSGAAPSV